jgi:hypothetical protein
MSEERINKLEKNIEALTDLILKMHEKKEEPKIEVKQEEPKIDPYQAKIQEEERIKQIKEETRKRIEFENKVNNFNKIYKIDDEVYNRVASINNETIDYKASILLDEKFKDGNFINSLSSNLKNKINNYLALNIDSKKQEALNMIDILDEAEEQFNKLEEAKYKNASNNNQNTNKEQFLNALDLVPTINK